MYREGSAVTHLTGTTLSHVAILQEADDVAAKRGAVTPDGAKSIGARLAAIRKERGLSQSEIALRLGISQPIVSDYERGELRLHGELLLQLADILGVSSDEILGIKLPERPASAPTKRRFLRRLQMIDRLPKRDQQALLRTIDAFLSRAMAS
jgi:transcriptional regulator with XRE-family HTH domain